MISTYIQSTNFGGQLNDHSQSISCLKILKILVCALPLPPTFQNFYLSWKVRLC